MTKAETFLLVICLPAVMLALLVMAMVAILERKFNHPRGQEANGGSEKEALARSEGTWEFGDSGPYVRRSSGG